MNRKKTSASGALAAILLGIFCLLGAGSAFADRNQELYTHAAQLDRDGFFEDGAKAWAEAVAGITDPRLRLLARIRLSMDHFRLVEMDQALAVARELASAEPQNFEAQFHLANQLAALKNYPEAIAAYRKTIPLRPDEGLAQVGLALAQFGNGDSATATKILFEAKELFRKQKNISWHRDAQLMIAQIEHFAQFPPDFANLWLEKNIKNVRETFEQGILKQ